MGEQLSSNEAESVDLQVIEKELHKAARRGSKLFTSYGEGVVEFVAVDRNGKATLMKLFWPYYDQGTITRELEVSGVLLSDRNNNPVEINSSTSQPLAPEDIGYQMALAVLNGEISKEHFG